MSQLNIMFKQNQTTSYKSGVYNYQPVCNFSLCSLFRKVLPVPVDLVEHPHPFWLGTQTTLQWVIILKNIISLMCSVADCHFRSFTSPLQISLLRVNINTFQVCHLKNDKKEHGCRRCRARRTACYVLCWVYEVFLSDTLTRSLVWAVSGHMPHGWDSK